MSDIIVPFQDFKLPYEELKSELDEAFSRFMRSGWYVLGKETEQFEEEYAEYCLAKYAVGVANGLEALRLSLLALDIGPDDEVIVPSNTYIATWLAVSHVGATPVAVEPDAQTYNINPDLISEAITTKTKAILAVNLYGQPCEYDSIREIADSHGIKFITDNAQSQGAEYKGRKVGGIADIECHSFYPSKNLGAYGEAGAITTNCSVIAERIKVLRNYGSRIRYHNDVIGYNARIDELQAALLRVKLRKLDEWNERRSIIANRYLSSLSVSNAIILPELLEHVKSVWHLFVIRHAQRDALQSYLSECGIQTLVHYPIPPHLSAAYSKEGSWRSTGPLVMAERLATENLSIPIFPQQSMKNTDHVCAQISEFSRLRRS